MRLADLNSTVRTVKITDAVNGALRQTDAAMPTSQLVKRVSLLLGTDETDLIARTVVRLAPDHPSARQTGETFQKFGKIMRRWEWTPLTKKGKPRGETPEEVDARRERQRQAEAEDDEWTVHPAPAEFLEDDE